MKILGPITDFPTWGSSKGTENPQVIWLWRPVGFGYRTYTRLGKKTVRGHKQKLGCTRTWEVEAVTPTRGWARIACGCPGVFGGGVGQQWPATGSGHWLYSWEPQGAGINPLERGQYYLHYPYHSLASMISQDKVQGRNSPPPINRLIKFIAAKDGEALYSQKKTRAGADYGSCHELLMAKFKLKLKKVGKTTRPLRYDLNQIPYD